MIITRLTHDGQTIIEVFAFDESQIEVRELSGDEAAEFYSTLVNSDKIALVRNRHEPGWRQLATRSPVTATTADLKDL